MKRLLQRLVREGGQRLANRNETRLTLAAFGKHPGWDDHMPGIGVETEMLAYLKQALYVGGIGGQIDSGAWEKLDEEKRLEGFDHTLLWLSPGHAVLGQLWSSTDRKARSKYPMVLCLDGENITPEFLLDKPRVELDRLREECKLTTSADHVAFECRTAQDQLRAWLNSRSTESDKVLLSFETRQRFLRRREFGPDSLGLFRVMHELDNATGRSDHRSSESKGAADLRPYHVRVPLCADSQTEGLLLWIEFLVCVLPHSVPRLLLARNGTDWLDLIIGKPGRDDLFCLQTSLKGLPLATEIPYDVAPELKLRLRELEDKFLGTKQSKQSIGGNQENGNGSGSLRVPPPLPEISSGSDVKKTLPESKRQLLLGLGGAAVALSLFGWWFAVGVRRSASTRREKSYQTALADGRVELVRSNYLAAIGAAKRALELKPNDGHAMNLKGQAETAQGVLIKREQEFRRAMDDAQAALRQKDYSRAIAAATRALALQPGDTAAARLKADAETQQRRLAKLERDFKTAMEAEEVAFRQKEYVKAIAAANQALALKPNNVEATKLKANAETLQAVADKLEQDFKAAIHGAQVALQQQNYVEAIAAASQALELKPNNAEATKLKANAEMQQARVVKLEQDFKTAVQGARLALQQKDYVKAIAAANQALGLKPNNPEANSLKTDAEKQQGLWAKSEQEYLRANKLFADGNYEEASKLCDAHLEVDQFKKLSQQIREEQAQLKTVTLAFNEGRYDFVLQAKLPDKPSFHTLKAQAIEENRAYQDAKHKLENGEYESVETLEKQSYKAKTPFVAVLEVAREERDELKRLQALRQTDQIQALRENMAKLPETVRSKKPFAELLEWAKSRLNSEDPPAELVRLDGLLEMYEIWFRLKNENPSVLGADGKPAKPLQLGRIPGPQFFAVQRNIEKLRDDYEKGGWLDRRATRLKKVSDALQNWR